MMKVVLAYSGGLDTSVILKWIQERYDAEMITYTGDVGQGEAELERARRGAERHGAADVVVEDLKRELVEECVFPALRANAVYEWYYLLGTALARPVLARGLVRAAERAGADAIAHGATGKGNDQIRFELAGRHGVGRVDIVENRYLGMKSRGCYETPGGTLLHHARRAVESITLDRELHHLRDELVPRYADMVYNGLWFSPEREALQSFMDSVQRRVNGEARSVGSSPTARTGRATRSRTCTWRSRPAWWRPWATWGGSSTPPAPGTTRWRPTSGSG